jgi:hypothetical protein
MRKSLLIFLQIYFCSICIAQESKIRLKKDGDFFNLEIIDNKNNILLKNAQSGLWAVATNWENNWMSSWSYSKPDSVSYENNHIILYGKIKLPNGNLLIRDTYKTDKNIIKCFRRFNWTGIDTLKNTTLTVQFVAPKKGKKIVMPGILYHGNPSGKKSGKTPFYEGNIGEMAFFEEHRFPMPFVSFEWGEKELYGAALHSKPSTVPYGNLNDQWWSLGAETTEEGTILTLLSGACSFNNKKSVIKAFQGNGNKSMFANYDKAYINIPPNAIIEKEFYLETYALNKKGTGFQNSVKTSLEIFSLSLDGLPKFEDIIKSKYQFTKSRWIETEKYAGFNQFDRNLKKYDPVIVLGWVGQAAAPGYAFQLLQDELNDKFSLEMAQRSLDFVSTTTFYDQGFYTWFHTNNEEWGTRIWKENPELLSQGQAMFNIANAINAAKKSRLNTTKWKDFLKKSSDFHSNRILENDWNPKSTDEAFFIAPLALASDIFKNNKYKKAAIKIAKKYAYRNIDLDEVYWGGTLDASCEDKEGAFGAFQGFLALYELTKEDKYLEWAKHAAEITISYTVVWDIEFPAGRLRDHNFKTRGWTTVSVQNMHIDVYGVFIAPFVYKLGLYTKNEKLKQLAKIMFLSCGQLIDAYGSQGEQLQQTNYTQDHLLEKNHIGSFRGNYIEDWTVFWITSHFLNAGAMFKEMGIEFK